MKIVADANVPRPIIIGLRQVGHEVTFILEMAPRMPDPDILKLAAQDDALLVTCDNDFRQLAIEARRPCSGVLLIRLEALPLKLRADIIHQSILQYGNQLHHSFTALYPDHIEMDQLPEEKR